MVGRFARRLFHTMPESGLVIMLVGSQPSWWAALAGAYVIWGLMYRDGPPTPAAESPAPPAEED